MGLRDLAADSDANLWATWRHIGANAPLGGVEEDDDILAVASGCPVPTFNPVFVRRVPPGASAAAAIVRRAIDRDVPVVVTVNPRIDNVEALRAAAHATGLVEGNPLPGMALYPIPTDATRRPVEGAAEPEITFLDGGTDDDEWSTYFDVVCRGFGVPREVVEPIAHRSVFADEHVRAFLARVDGEPVATSMAFVSGDIGGVYNVSTIESARRRGLGETLTWAAIDWTRARGAEVAVLQASRMGRPVYERMGFVEAVPYLQLLAPE